MSTKPKDQRPKVISFNQSLGGLNIAAEQNILWPCHAFNISIPQKKKSSLNMFEETVLKITEVESGDTRKIADVLCLNEDTNGKETTELISFIQNRLHNLGLLDGRYELSKDGKKLLESGRNSSEENVEYVAGTVFVDLHSGKLLPYIHDGNLKHEKITSIDGDFITVEIGSTGKANSQRCRLIRPVKDSFWKTVPDSNDIIRGIREFKKRYKRYALLNQIVDQYPPPIPMAEAVSVHGGPELIHLHCNMLIQIGNSDILVTDGCGFGFSESFTRYLTKNSDREDLRWVQKFKEKGCIEEGGIKSTEDGVDKNNKWKFIEVTKRINNSKRDISVLNISPSTSAKEKDYIQKRQQIASKMYEALEWLIRYSISEYLIPEWEQIFKSRNYKDNENILCNFAEKIGFSVSKTNRSILQVKAGAIRQIDRGNVELQPLLAIAITGAAVKYHTHPFHNLALNHSGFLEFTWQLKKLRDPIAHGDISDFETEKNSLEHLLDRLIEIGITLLPLIESELKQEISNVHRYEFDANQERLKAEIEIEKNLGLAFFMPNGIKEQLLRSEMMLAKYSDNEVIEIIKCYASIMQIALFEIIVNRKHPAKIEGDIREAAIRQMVESNFYLSTSDIPQQISTVNVERLSRTVQGTSITLGANLLAIFLLGSKNELSQLGNLYPKFVEFIANLIRLRGHGNEQRHDFSRDDIVLLKNNVFKAIKIITEVF